MDEETQRALDKAARSLGMRAHSEQELVKKLEHAGFDERAIAGAMAKLAEYGYIDDAAFAAHWVAARERRRLGRYRIAQELRQKGIDTETAEAALGAMDEDDALEAAAAIAEKQLARGGANARKRAYDAIVRRGHSYDTARSALALAERRLAEE